MEQAEKHKIYDLLNTTFKDIALCLGGIFLTHKAKDKLIWEITDSIEDIYYESMDKLESILGAGIMFDLESHKNDLHPHPAIEKLLKTINFKPQKKNASRS